MPIKSLPRTSPFWKIRSWLPGKADRYVLREILGSLGGSLAFLMGLLAMFQVLRLSDFFVTHGVFDLTAPKILGLITIGFLPYILPIAVLVSVLSTFARLSSESELIALKSCGFSIQRISSGVLFVGAGATLTSLALSSYVLPLAETELRTIYNKIDNSKVIKVIEEGRFTPGFFDLLIYVDKKDQASGRLKRVFIFDERDEDHPVAVISQEAALKSVRSATEHGSSGVLKLYKGHIHQVPEPGQDHRRISFGEYRLFLNLEGGSQEIRQRPRMLNSLELQKEIKNSQVGTKQHKNLTIELWSRLAGALASPLLALLGVGLGTTRKRGGRANAILLSILVFLAYWGLQSLGISLVQDGKLQAPFALNIPNIISLIGCVWALRRAAW